MIMPIGLALTHYPSTWSPLTLNSTIRIVIVIQCTQSVMSAHSELRI